MESNDFNIATEFVPADSFFPIEELRANLPQISEAAVNRRRRSRSHSGGSQRHAQEDDDVLEPADRVNMRKKRPNKTRQVGDNEMMSISSQLARGRARRTRRTRRSTSKKRQSHSNPMADKMGDGLVQMKRSRSRKRRTSRSKPRTGRVTKPMAMKKGILGAAMKRRRRRSTKKM